MGSLGKSGASSDSDDLPGVLGGVGTLGASQPSDDLPEGVLGGVGTLGESGASDSDELPELVGLLGGVGTLGFTESALLVLDPAAVASLTSPTRAFLLLGSSSCAAKSWLLVVASFCMRQIFGADAEG